MSRGRSDQALDAAVPVARMRGEVMFLVRRPGDSFDFLVSGPGGSSAVSVERALRIHGTPAELAASRPGLLARIIAAPLAPGIARELWFWAPWGTMRYFRVEAGAITELDRFGIVRAPLVKGQPAGAMRPRYRKSRKKAGSTPTPPAPGPEKSSGPADSLQPPGTAGPAPATPGAREPAPARYLRRRAKEKREAELVGKKT